MPVFNYSALVRVWAKHWEVDFADLVYTPKETTECDKQQFSDSVK